MVDYKNKFLKYKTLYENLKKKKEKEKEKTLSTDKNKKNKTYKIELFETVDVPGHERWIEATSLK